jgi:hypothetical protein
MDEGKKHHNGQRPSSLEKASRHKYGSGINQHGNDGYERPVCEDIVENNISLQDGFRMTPVRSWLTQQRETAIKENREKHQPTKPANNRIRSEFEESHVVFWMPMVI